jgi:receptor protein-tyrosine kinase
VNVDARLVKRAAVGAAFAAVFAFVVVCASLLQTPAYEASALILLDESSPAQVTRNGKIQLIPLAPAPEELQALTQTMATAIESRPVAKEAIQRLGLDMSPDELLSNLAIEQVETSQFIQLSYADNDPARAQRVVNAVGEAFSGHRVVEGATGSYITATLYDKSSVPDAPVSPKPLRNGLVALVASLALSATLVAGRELWRR